jgi:hypothetical protein
MAPRIRSWFYQRSIQNVTLRSASFHTSRRKHFLQESVHPDTPSWGLGRPSIPSQRPSQSHSTLVVPRKPILLSFKYEV